MVLMIFQVYRVHFKIKKYHLAAEEKLSSDETRIKDARSLNGIKLFSFYSRLHVEIQNRCINAPPYLINSKELLNRGTLLTKLRISSLK